MPASGKISVNIFKGGAGPAAGGGGGGPPSAAPGRASQGTQANPTIISGSIQMAKMLSPLLLLYSIDRTMRAFGLTSTVAQGMIGALGAIWSAIADTLLLPLLPEFMKLIEFSMKIYEFLRFNWPRSVEQIRQLVTNFFRNLTQNGPLSAAGGAIGDFMNMDNLAKFATIAGVIFMGTFATKLIGLAAGILMSPLRMFGGGGAGGRGGGGFFPMIGSAPFLLGAGAFLLGEEAKRRYESAKTPEDIKTAKQFNTGALLAAIGAGGLQGAMMSSKFGPWGALIGGGVGAALGGGAYTIYQNNTFPNVKDIDRIGEAQKKLETDTSFQGFMMRNFQSSNLGNVP